MTARHRRSRTRCCWSTARSSPATFSRWVRENHPTVEIALAGTLDAAAEAAAEFCDEGPRLARPYDPAAIVERVRLMRERHRQRTANG